MNQSDNVENAGSVVDPVCGMKVDTSRARFSQVHGGKTFFFCSGHCLEKFRATPNMFQNPAPQKHVELLVLSGGKATSSTSVKDPVCHMDVDPATAKFKFEHAGKTFYFCCGSCLEKFRALPVHYLSQQPRSADLVQIAPRKAASPHIHSSAEPSKPTERRAYVCPMCPEVRETAPVPCPKCGMALEPESLLPQNKVEYTCPMHPEIVRPGPGSCPICGMALEPRNVTAHEEVNPELRDMTRRFWISVILTIPLLAVTMGSMLWPHAFMGGLSLGGRRIYNAAWQPWLELLLATPVVLWAGWPFFQRGWASIVNRSTNMFTLIAMGTGVAYLYSLIATVFPQLFPASVPDHG